MAARKSTTKKTAKSTPRGKQAARRAPEPEPVMSRAAWGAIWAVLGLLCLLSILPIDGVLLAWIHRGVGAVIGMGSYVLPFALLALAAESGSALWGIFLLAVYAVGHSILTVVAGTSYSTVEKWLNDPAYEKISRRLRNVLGLVILIIGILMIYFAFLPD